jgi:hypothetical protein
LKPSGVAAFSAKLFRCHSAGKTVIQIFGTGGGEYLIHFLFQKIAQGNVTFVIQTTGNDCAVAQNTQLIP